jgi:type IX secretion system PorP/SprF family membrane protein
MKQLYILISFLLIISFSVNAQQRPAISQYMFNGVLLNPAFAGGHNMLSATALHRDQWINFPGSPRMTNFSLHSSVRDGKVGLGMMAMREGIGVHNDFGLYTMYAYRIKMNTGVLSMGLQGGFNYRISDWSLLNRRDLDDPNFTTGDSPASNFSPNFGTGLFYYNKQMYLGFSIPYLINNRIVNEEGGVVMEGKEKRYYYFLAGYVFDLSEKLKFRPSTLLRIQESAPIGYDLNANFIIDDILTIGASYRSGDALVALFEMKISPSIRFGYAYDIVTSSLHRHNQGTHEFMLNFRINPASVNNWIPCPSFLN